MNIPKGEMKRRSTGVKIQHSIGGSDIGGEAANSVQKVWTDNTKVLIASFINGFGRRQNTTLWNGTGNFRLDLQTTDATETRFAFQESDAVHGQVHLKSLPNDAKVGSAESDANKTIAHFLTNAMEASLKDGTIWEVYYAPYTPKKAQDQGKTQKK